MFYKSLISFTQISYYYLQTYLFCLAKHKENIMLKNKITLFSVLIGVIGISIIALVSFNGIAQTGQNNNQPLRIRRKAIPNVTPPSKITPTEQELDDAATPLVDFNSSTNEGTDTKRKLKNKKFNNQYFVVAEPDPNAGEAVRSSETSIPEFPVEMSDLVIEGKITDSNAFLSEDKSGVYSEFTVSVSDVIISKPSISVKKHDVITTDRDGGRVRYPSGRIVRYRISSRGFPIKNGKYLFFLTKDDDDDNDYRIITAYEMRGNKVYALDGSRVNFRGMGRSPFDKHNGKDLKDFKLELDKALKGEINEN